ncbi:16S rRNA (uracil(1498)-N(3))-methyltransferase [Lactobacillus sp. UCMA15818]|uniref:16S rRNA (uracil(1498)-N(3))-methyltransferase n=1 Tax=Lactobacillus sp. UCMA15818 TaxID=2583394 RepID=UPI0025AF4E5B|nr:16S rRNA (uracil(1498)-N(3))-methyltransferase [Lactobacillus sp. UCMA15818]MDN2452328.1 16S rRNA (uracil(1498)-N(3))-methyltransferase [Lactobacillus sp. UCMA15818]
MQRYFIAKFEIADDLVLPADIYHHAIRVMRLHIDSQFELVLQTQKVALMRIKKITKEEAHAELISWVETDVELPVSVTIACALSKNDKAEWIVQKGTELGASKFIFFAGEFSVAKWDPKKVAKKVERLTKVALNAAQQAHRTQIPSVQYCPSLTAIELPHFDYRLVAYEESAKKGEKSNLFKLTASIKKKITASTQPKLLAVFGTEGGISPLEVEYMDENSFIFAGFGPRIMRAETAPLYLLAALSFALELG